MMTTASYLINRGCVSCLFVQKERESEMQKVGVDHPRISFLSEPRLSLSHLCLSLALCPSITGTRLSQSHQSPVPLPPAAL